MPTQALLASRRHASIAPAKEVELGAGNNSGTRWQIHDPIEVNALALWHGDQPPIVVLSFDLLYPGPAVVAAVRAAWPELPVENVLISATHTHTAPMTDDTKPALSSPDPEYLASLTATFTRLAEGLLDPSNRTPVTLEVTRGTSSHGVNRRRRFPLYFSGGSFKRNVVLPAPDPTGPVDDTVLVATLRAEGGSPFAVIWNYACHPVGFPSPKTVSAHFPGTVRHRIRAEFGDDTAVLFLQGFSGDIRPNLPVHPTAIKNRIQRLLFGFGSGPFRADEFERWSTSLAETVLRLIPRGHSETESVTPSATQSEKRAEQHQAVTPKFFAARHLFDGNRFAGPTDLKVSLQLMALNEGLVIVAMSAEVVHEYAAYIRGKFPETAVMCVGCIDTPIGYIPTGRMLEEGGYEAGGYCASFSLDSVSPNVEAATKAAFDSVIEAWQRR